MLNKTILKQAIISILVGAVTAFLTSLLQGLLDYVNHFQVDIISGASATGWYIRAWKIGRLG